MARPKKKAIVSEQIGRWLDSLQLDADCRTRYFDKTMEERVQRGAAAVEAGSGEFADSAEPPEQNLSDTLTNLMHWADYLNANLAHGEEPVSFENALRIATNHHSEERAGEE
jgi:hypothetical protein